VEYFSDAFLGILNVSGGMNSCTRVCGNKCACTNT